MNAITTETVTVQTRGGSIRVEVEPHVGPLGAFRSSGAASKLLDRYADLLDDRDVTGGTILRLRADDGQVWHVPALTYNRPVRR